MVDKTVGLKKYAHEKTQVTIDRVDKAIREISIRGECVNFNSVVKESGVSKSFLYNQKEIRERIEELRQKQINREINQRAKTDKTSKSKDIIIMAKDKKIRELEDENRRMKEQLKVLRGKIYERI